MKFIKNYMKGLLLDRVNDIILEDTKNIDRYMQRKALKETCIFIEEFMNNVPSFPGKFSLLNHSIQQVVHNIGIFCEFGVYSGTTINYIADLLSEVRIYGFDSFEGIPKDWNTLPKGHFALKKLPKVKSNVSLIKGWFQETIPDFIKNLGEGQIAFLHIDSDLYSSAKVIFDLLGNRICPGTIIVFDEYFNYPGWKTGEYKAFMEYTKKTASNIEYIGYCAKGEQCAIKIK